MSRANPSLAVGCPKCGAEPEGNCTTRVGTITATHPERTAAARPAAEPPRTRPAEPTVEGLAELEALRAEVADLRATVARVGALGNQLDNEWLWRGTPARGSYDDGVNQGQTDAAARIRRTLDGDRG